MAPVHPDGLADPKAGPEEAGQSSGRPPQLFGREVAGGEPRWAPSGRRGISERRPAPTPGPRTPLGGREGSWANEL